MVDLQAGRRSKERELEHQSSEMKKRQGRLLEVKTNKEYSAILQEIQVLKDKQSDLEDEILEVLDKIDQQGKEAEGQTEHLARAKEVVLAGKDKMGEEIGGDRGASCRSFEGKGKETARYRTCTHPDLYSHLRESPGSGGGAGNGSQLFWMFCELDPTDLPGAKRNDRIITCSNCNRIIYWKEG